MEYNLLAETMGNSY